MFRAGMIGVGSIANSHRLGMIDSGKFELVRICNGGNRERLLSRSQEWGVPFSENCDELMQDDSLDCIIVASPPDVHFTQAQQALFRRKHVLVEKPVALHAEKILALEMLSRQVGRVCMPGHNGMYDPGIARMIDIVKNNGIGRVVLSRFYKTFILAPSRAQGWRSDRCASGGGILLDMGIHFAYLMQAMFGLPDEVYAFISNDDEEATESTAVLSARYRNGHISTMQVSSVTQNDGTTPWIAIGGTSGRLDHSDRLYVDGEAVEGTERDNNFTAMYKAFAGAIVGDVEPLSTISDAVCALRIVKAGYESARQRRTVSPASF